MSKTEKYDYESNVEFGGVSVGDETAAIGVKFNRENFDDLSQSDELLCGRRLKVELSPNNGEQKQLEGMEGVGLVTSICDVKRFSVSPKNITARLTFNLQEVDVQSLSTFAKKSGSVKMKHIEDLSEEKAEATQGDNNLFEQAGEDDAE